MPWRTSRAEAEDEGRPTLTTPSGVEIRLAVSGGELRLPPLEEVGVWTLEGDGRRMRFATSLVDAAESDLAPPEAAGDTAASRRAAIDVRPAQAPRDTLRGLWRPLVALAVGLLVLEALAFHRRWTL